MLHIHNSVGGGPPTNSVNFNIRLCTHGYVNSVDVTDSGNFTNSVNFNIR